MTNPPPLTRSIGEAERTLQALLQRQLKEAGLSFAEWVAMTLVSGATPLTLSSLTEAMAAARVVLPGTERPFLVALIEKGILTGEATLSLTETGAGVFQPLRRRVQGITASLTADISPGDIDTARRVLEMITARAAQSLAETAS